MSKEKFTYDPEADDEKNAKALRLPFALCKANGIAIQDWWTPKNAWEALRKGGIVDDVSEEYAEFFREQKKMAQKMRREELKPRNAIRKAQRKNPEHNPDTNYKHRDGMIAGVKKGAPMSFEDADSGRVNPYFGKNYDPYTRSGEVIGYRTNCQTCVATYIARRQGYDVRALPNLDNKNIMQLSHNTNLAYTNYGVEKQRNPREKSIDFINRVCQNDGEICSIEFEWKNKSGHIIIAERHNGLVFLYDPQTNVKYRTKEDISKFLLGTKNMKSTNLTNAKIDEQFADGIMKGVKNGNK